MGTRVEEDENNKLTTTIDYVVGLISFIERKIDDEYYELLSKAIEYGMTPKEFWEEDLQYFYCYQVAYINKSYNEAYTHGFYNHIAFSTTMGAMFAESGKKAPEYPSTNIYNPLNEKHSKKPTNAFKQANRGETSKGFKKLFHIKRIIDKKKGVE